jgi:hypothetical protein
MAKKEKKVVEVKDYDNELYGYSGGKETYTPEVFAEMGIPEDKWFTVDVEPMSDKDCAVWRTINAKTKVDVALNRTGERGDTFTRIKKKLDDAVAENPEILVDDILSPSEKAFLMSNSQYEKSLDDIFRKMEIVFPYLSNLKNHREENLTDTVWSTMPNNIREDIYNKVVLISNVSVGESINLL